MELQNVNQIMIDKMEDDSNSVISCKVLRSLPGVILVSYENDEEGKTYQGALLDISKR